MYLIPLIQYVVDEQPKSSRGANFLIKREDHNNLLLGITGLYISFTQDNKPDPEPDELMIITKSWLEDVTLDMEESLKSSYRAFIKSIISYYFNLYHGVDEKLKNMLDSI